MVQTPASYAFALLAKIYVWIRDALKREEVEVGRPVERAERVEERPGWTRTGSFIAYRSRYTSISPLLPPTAMGEAVGEGPTAPPVQQVPAVFMTYQDIASPRFKEQLHSLVRLLQQR